MDLANGYYDMPKNQRFFHNIFYWRERHLLPIAKKIHRQATAEQMTAEKHWG